MVRPESATMASLLVDHHHDNCSLRPSTTIYPHLQHYNIGIAAQLWKEDMPKWIRGAIARSELSHVHHSDFG